MIKRKRENPLIKFLFGKEEQKIVETIETGVREEPENRQSTQIQTQPDVRPERTVSRKGTHPLPFLSKESATEGKESTPVEETDSLEISDEQISAEATEAIEQFISEYPEQSVGEEILTAKEDSDVVEEAVIADIEQALNETAIDLEFLPDAGVTEASPSGKGPLFDAIDFEAKTHEKLPPESSKQTVVSPSVTDSFFVASNASDLSRLILNKVEPVVFAESPIFATPDRELAALDLLSEPEAESAESEESDVYEDLSWELDISEFEVLEASDAAETKQPEDQFSEGEDVQDVILAESAPEEDLIEFEDDLIDLEEESATEETEPPVTIDFSPFEDELAADISYPVLEKPTHFETETVEEEEITETGYPDIDKEASQITASALGIEATEVKEAAEITHSNLEKETSLEAKSAAEDETADAELFALTDEPSDDLTYEAPALLEDAAYVSDIDERDLAETDPKKIEEGEFTALQAEAVSVSEADIETDKDIKNENLALKVEAPVKPDEGVLEKEESGQRNIFDFLQSLKISGEAASDMEDATDEVSADADESYTADAEISDDTPESLENATTGVKQPEKLENESDSAVSVDDLLQMLGQSESYTSDEEVFTFPDSEGNLSDLEDLSVRAAQLRDDSADGSTLDLGSAIFNNEQEITTGSDSEKEMAFSGEELTEPVSTRSPKRVSSLFETPESPETSDKKTDEILESEEEVESEEDEQTEDDVPASGEFHFDSYRDVTVKGDYSASSIIPGDAVVGEVSVGSLAETGLETGTDYFEDEVEPEAETEPFGETDQIVEKQLTGSGLAALIETEILEELPPLQEDQELQEKDYQEIRSLFDDAHIALDQEQEDSDFSFGFEQLQSVEEPEQVRLLFELAYDGIVSPEEIDEYVDEVETAPKELEAKDLSNTLEQTRKELSAPRLTLKGSSMARAKKPSEIYGTEPRLRRIKKPDIFRRLGATLVDIVGTGIFAAVLTVIGLYFIDPAFTAALFSGIEVRTVHQYLVAEVAVLSFLLSLILYPLFFYLKYKKTPGNMLTDTVLVSKDINELTFYQISLRALLFPLSLLCFGYLPLITGRGSLHDWGSFTALTRNRRQANL